MSRNPQIFLSSPIIGADVRLYASKVDNAYAAESEDWRKTTFFCVFGTKSLI